MAAGIARAASGGKAADTRLRRTAEAFVRQARTFHTVAMATPGASASLPLYYCALSLAKAELVQRIRELIAERKLTQAKAAELLGLDQPKVSALVRGRVEGFTYDRLFRFLNALGQRVEITVRPNGKSKQSRPVVVS